MTVLSLAAVLGSVFGLAYLLYAPARVADAIQRAARTAGLTATYSMSLPRRPGSTLIRNLTLSHAPHAWSLHIGAVEVNLAPVLGGPRQIRLELLEQPMRLQRSELVWECTLSARMQLAGLGNSSLNALRAVEITAQNGVLDAGGHAARNVTMKLRLTEATAGELSGPIAVRGIAHSKLLQQLGLRREIRGLVQTEFDASFVLQATLTLTAAAIRLDDITGNWGDASFEGRLAWLENRAEGTLLVTTPTHRVAIFVIGDEARIEPAVGGRETILHTPGVELHTSHAPAIDGSS